jgi:chromosome segregation ATPase
MATLWEQYATYRDLVARAREVRARRNRPGDEEIEELTHILNGPVIELDSEAVPIERRGLTGPSQVTERITMADLLARMRQAFDTVTAVLAAAESAWSAAIGRLDPLDSRVRAVSVLAESVASGADEVARVHKDLERARELVLTDVLTAQATDVVPDIERRLTDLERRLSALARIRDEFGPRLTALENVLSDLEAAEATARQTYTAVVEKIASPGLPEPTDQGSATLRGRLQRLTARQGTTGWAALAKEADELDRFAASTLDAARTSVRAIAGLLDRRAELRGRLEAYQVKAARLGHSEDAELTRLHDDAHGILFTAPCDLPAATRALNRYRQAIQDRTREERTE